MDAALFGTMDAVGWLAAFSVVTALGLTTGLLAGLSPGLHVNNVAALVLATQGAWLAFLAGVAPGAAETSGAVELLLSTFLVATAASHAVFSFIPSVFLGAPTEDTALATLPGHRLLVAGQGAKAVALAGRGAVLGTACAVLLLVPLRLLLAQPVDLAERFRPWSAFFLLAVLVALLAAEGRGRHALRRLARAAFVQGMAGLLGVATLLGGLPVHPDLILFPLFSGLFGVPGLLISLKGTHGVFPEQRVERLRPMSRSDARGALRGTAAGAAISWLPGLSGGAAATLASVGSRRRVGPSQFMVMLGAVSASTGLLSIAVLFMIGRSRSGAAAAIRSLVGEVAPWAHPWAVPVSLVVLMLAGVVAAAVAAPLAARLACAVARRWSHSNPRRVAGLSLFAIGALLVVATGPVGVGIAGIATLLGLVPIALRVRRVHLMASLLVPVLLSYVGGGH